MLKILPRQLTRPCHLDRRGEINSVFGNVKAVALSIKHKSNYFVFSIMTLFWESATKDILVEIMVGLVEKSLVRIIILILPRHLILILFQVSSKYRTSSKFFI